MITCATPGIAGALIARTTRSRLSTTIDMQLILPRMANARSQLRLLDNSRLPILSSSGPDKYNFEFAVDTPAIEDTPSIRRVRELLKCDLYAGVCGISIPERSLRETEYLGFSICDEGFLSPVEVSSGEDWPPESDTMYVEFHKRTLNRHNSNEDILFLLLERETANWRVCKIADQTGLDTRRDEVAHLALTNLLFAMISGGDSPLQTDSLE